MKIVYLGTSAAMPTRYRGLSSQVLVLGNEYIVVDAGDGTGRQYIKSELKHNKPMTVLITHLHSDHISGLLPLLQTMDMGGRTEPITVYGVRGTKRYIEAVYRSGNFKFNFEFKIHDLDERETNTILLKSGVMIATCKTSHRVPSMAFRIRLPDRAGKLDIERCLQLGVPNNSPLLGKLKSGETVEVSNETGVQYITSEHVVGKPQKGLVIGFSGDTRPIDPLIPFFKDTDFLTFESTYLDEEKEKAVSRRHTTAAEAGQLAQTANVKILILTHFSARHTTTEGFYDEASEFHRNVKVAKDFMEIELD